MSTFSFTDLHEIMRQVDDQSAAGVTEDAIDTPFPDLDFDSLAVLEITTRIQQQIGLAIPDEAIEDMKTPRAALDYVNERLAAV